MKRILPLSLAFCAALAISPAGPAARAAPRQSAPGQASGPIYIVQQGDSCAYIAVRFGVSLADLILANGLSDDCRIFPDDRLIIPGLDGITGVLTTKAVEFGETLSTLSLRYGLSQDALLKLNKVVNPDRVYVGQSLVVTEPEAGAPAAPRWDTGRAYSVSAGMPLIALAAAEGRNPWELASLNGLSSMADQFAGQMVYLTGGGDPLRAWPEPLTDVRFRTLPLVQGITAEITLSAPADAQAAGSLGEYPLQFRPAGSELVALQGVYSQAVPGIYPFSVKLWLPNGKVVFFQQDVPLISGDYITEAGFITVPPETLDPATIQSESDLIKSIIAPFTEERFWQGLFVAPSKRGISSYFGNWRFYNGGVYGTFHGGVDFYGLEKEPILAPAPGRVVFVQPLVICGNATIIDHGWGVYTRYCHQSEFKVQVGDIVQTGQEIGLIGHTGRADGPHLHWEVWVGGVQVNPLQWVDELFP